jgi:Holliday junction resolvasome RuvABC endonuclease subunit
MKQKTTRDLVLALYPTSRGFAFVLFEGPETPFDWGVKDIKGPKKNAKCIDAIEKLIEEYPVQAIIIENTNENGSRRSERIRRLYRSIAHLAESRNLDIEWYSRREIRETFAGAGAATKYEIATLIAQRMPGFTHRLPRLRKLWMSEDPRQSLFDAIALGIVYYSTRRCKKHRPIWYAGSAEAADP